MNLFHSSSCIFVFVSIICIHGVFSKSQIHDSYAKHCSSLIPPFNITALSDGDSLPSLSTSYFTGGDRFQRNELDLNYKYASKNLRLRLRSKHYQTTAAGVYKVEGFLHINFANGYDGAPGGRAPLRFSMNGFWSEKSRKLCMVGSTLWEAIDFDAVLKLKFDDENPTVYTGVVSGSLESTASATFMAYFDPILIFDFPESVADYRYSLALEESGAAFPTREGESLSLDSTEFCTVMERGLLSLELRYATECADRRRPQPRRCSPKSVGDGSLPDTVYLTSIQCAKGSKKARILAKFLDKSVHDAYDHFALGSVVIGEAWWDAKNNRIIGVGCRILNPSLQLGNSVGDCSMRLSFRHPPVLTLRNDGIIVGEIWSSKAVEDSGYFTPINVTFAGDHGAVLGLPEQRYEYTEVGRARKWCAMEIPSNRTGNIYPDGHSNDLRFDTYIKNSQGRFVASAYASPVRVESNLFGSRSSHIIPSSAIHQLQKLQLVERGSNSSPTRMSYKIIIRPSFNYLDDVRKISTLSLDWPVTNPSDGLQMTAEGEYDAETGHLCMVGCRKLAGFKDCEVVLEFDLPMLAGERGRLVKGILRSMRPQTDPLHFEDLVIESTAYNQGEAKRSIWRMDFEIGMVFISNALICIFVALQIFHVKRNPEVLSSVSLVMLVILCAGHVIPLVLNFDAVFLGYRDRRMVELGNGGRLEANEVAVRVISMVTLLLQLRLLQLVYARKELWSGERKAGFVCVSFYVFGCLLSLDVRKTHGVWGDLRSYGGVILDGFLLPQIVSNVFRGSDAGEEALRRWFYVGMSAVRLVPHAYNQYRSRNYPRYDVEETYYYANPAADLYSTAWDFMIPCGVMALAVMVFLQQRYGGRCILPQRFRGFGKMPTLDKC